MRGKFRFVIAQSFIPAQHPKRRISLFPSKSHGLDTILFRFFLGSFKKKFCYAMSAMRLVHPKIVNQSIRTSVGRFFFCLVGNTYLNASMVLFVGYDYANIVAPMLMLYHVICRGL